jgi:hypothetical protein
VCKINIAAAGELCCRSGASSCCGRKRPTNKPQDGPDQGIRFGAWKLSLWSSGSNLDVVRTENQTQVECIARLDEVWSTPPPRVSPALDCANCGAIPGRTPA